MFFLENGEVWDNIETRIDVALGTKVALKKLKDEERYDEFIKEVDTLRYELLHN